MIRGTLKQLPPLVIALNDRLIFQLLFSLLLG